MKIALSWLESYFATKPNWDEVFAKLTMAGIEIEDIKAVAPNFSGVVVAQVMECNKHPEADKLNICKVSINDGQLYQVICGAANVKAGIKVPFAQIGAILPNGMNIAERKMRGEVSYGMLCSGEEIACPDGVDGLLILDSDAPLGTNIRQYLHLDDTIVEFKITPNRGDCLSINGIIREIETLTNLKSNFNTLIHQGQQGLITDKVNITINNPELCPNYVALIIKNVNNQIKLPQFITERLEHSGIRCISPIVDIANYVMLELGQPLHAFDLNAVGSSLSVRLASDNEQVNLLINKLVTLNKNTLVICDQHNKVAAIAGVMGGFDSAVTANSSSIIIESAHFTPETIAGKTKQFGINSDAAYRFERGVDPQLQVKAALYASHLITKYCGGDIGPINQICATNLVDKKLSLSYAFIKKILGISISNQEIDLILTKLAFKFKITEDDLELTIPSFRFDINIAQDIVEEIARVYGYENIQPQMPQMQSNLDTLEDQYSITVELKKRLVNLGYSEIIGYAFAEEKLATLLGNPEYTPIKLQNPIAGLDAMRTSLVGDLIKALTSNLNRGHKNIKLFELSRVFYAEDSKEQPLKIAGLIHGDNLHSSFESPKRAVDFYDLKYAVESLLSGIQNIKYIACHNYSVFHSGRCAKIYHLDKLIGIMGQLHPKLSLDLDLAVAPYIFELDVEFLALNNNLATIRDIIKFQKVERDLAFVVNSQLPVAQIIEAINNAQIEYLQDFNVFDVFKMSEQQKSIALRFIFQANKTLAEEEINSNVNMIVSAVTKAIPDVQLRS
jgi:phenylalanyl-tRNA synthetase beta chain